MFIIKNLPLLTNRHSSTDGYNLMEETIIKVLNKKDI